MGLGGTVVVLLKLLIAGLIFPWLMALVWLVISAGQRAFLGLFRIPSSDEPRSLFQKLFLGAVMMAGQVVVFYLLLGWAAWTSSVCLQSISGAGVAKTFAWILALLLVTGPMRLKSGNEKEDGISSRHLVAVGLGFILFSVFPSLTGPWTHFTASKLGMSKADGLQLQVSVKEASDALGIYNSKEFVRKGFMKYTMEFSVEETAKIQASAERALSASSSISDAGLEAGHPNLKEMVRTKFEPGLRALLEFLKTGNMETEKQARADFNAWGSWIETNHEDILIRARD